MNRNHDETPKPAPPHYSPVGLESNTVFQLSRIHRELNALLAVCAQRWPEDGLLDVVRGAQYAVRKVEERLAWLISEEKPYAD